MTFWVTKIDLGPDNLRHDVQEEAKNTSEDECSSGNLELICDSGEPIRI